MPRLFALLLACGLSILPCTLAGPAATPQSPNAQPAPVARLRIEPADGHYLAWADNLLAGPVEVRLEPLADAPPSQPALPARAGLPANGSALVARVQLPAGQSGRLQLRLQGVPGSSNARPRDVLYQPPLAAATLRIEQGFDGRFSHQDAENRHALDFAAPVGTPVLAARDGIVMQVQDGFHRGGLERARDLGRANFIRILHPDGSMAVYAHLAAGGMQIRMGDTVTAGQHIGLSGNSGYSSAPHLHFAVQVNRGMQLHAIRFRMRGVADPSAGLVQH